MITKLSEAFSSYIFLQNLYDFSKKNFKVSQIKFLPRNFIAALRKRVCIPYASFLIKDWMLLPICLEGKIILFIYQRGHQVRAEPIIHSFRLFSSNKPLLSCLSRLHDSGIPTFKFLYQNLRCFTTVIDNRTTENKFFFVDKK